jgi:dTDP-4-amino-4,6-dideoxygalactose transaminase
MTIQPKPDAPIAFIDLAAQRRRLGDRVDQAILNVLAHGQYIMGPEIRMVEADLAAFCGAKHVLSCSSGTDALALILMAKKVKPGDAIFCPAFTFAATAEVVAWLGASPVFVDIEPDTYNMDPASLKQAIVTARRLGLKPVGVMPVDLFGLPSDYDPIAGIAEKEGLWLLADAAQSFGATYKGRKVGTIGFATATSFFPAKPLGCYGDGGAVFTEDDDLIEVLRSLRIHGQGTDKYENVRIGMTGRMDSIQGAVLIEKLKIFAEEIVARDRLAAAYNAALEDVCTVPVVPDGYTSVWAQYTVRVPADRRAAVLDRLKADGVPTAIYYPKPLHRQDAYKHYPSAANGLPVTDAVCGEVFSLPMHPYLDEATQARIIDAVRRAVAAGV